MRLLLIVEGPTERAALPDFVQRWLRPRIKRPLAIRPDVQKGCSNVLKNAVSLAKTRLSEHSASDIVGVIGLVDFRDVPFPKGCEGLPERYEWISKRVEGQVNNPRFRMHCAVHEMEAWLFSQPDIFPSFAAPASRLKNKCPEEINFDNPPSRQLAKLYDKGGKSFTKTVEGVNLFGKLDPEIAYEKCPYLRRLLDDILFLSRTAGL